MDIQSGREALYGKKYMVSVIDSMMKCLTNDDQNWRGLYNSADSYLVGDVVLMYGNDGSPIFRKAVINNSGSYNPIEWEDFEIDLSSKEYADGITVTDLDITLPTIGWEQIATDADGISYVLDVLVDIVTSGLFPLISIDRGSMNAATECGLFSGVETLDGRLRFYAATKPTQNIKITCTLIGGNRLSRATNAQGLRQLTIPTTGWVNMPNADMDGNLVYYDLASDVVTSSMVSFLTISHGSYSAAQNAGIHPYTDTLDGAIRIYAKDIPTSPINCEVTLISRPKNGSDDYVIQIPTTGWKHLIQEDHDGNQIYCDIPLDQAETGTFPIVSIARGQLYRAIECGLFPTAESRDGCLRVFAITPPTTHIDAIVKLIQIDEFATGAKTLEEHQTVITIPKNGWKELEVADNDGNTVYCDVPLEGVTMEITPFISLLFGSISVAVEAGLHPTVESFNGFVRFRAANYPSYSMTAEATIFIPGASSAVIRSSTSLSPEASDILASKTTYGIMKVGSGLNVVNGVVSIGESVLTENDIISPDEMQQEIDDILDK